ncbi:MAG TPA: OmpA family protein [Nitrospirales bacterium]|nr:OmpA family protein [Nitrospirales bacterium]
MTMTSFGLLGAVLVLSACSKNLHELSDTKMTRSAVGTPQAPVAPAQERPAPALSGPLQSDLYTSSAENRVTDANVVVSAQHVAMDAAGEHLLQDAFFSYDSWKLTEQGQKALAGDLDDIRAASTGSVLIEGHCDERGTEAYNLVLGERRAKAAAQYLTNLGVPANRIGVVSYGEKRPFCGGHGEACWQQNRRAHVVVRTS